MPARSYAVRPVRTGNGWVTSAPLLVGHDGDPLMAPSKTAAVRACRAAGYRVLTVGGLVELAADGRFDLSWHVTVHP